MAHRTQAGPAAEKERAQKIIQGLASLAFVATIVIPAHDRRFGWSRLALPAVVMGDILIALGFLIVFLVLRQNTFTPSIIEVAASA